MTEIRPARPSDAEGIGGIYDHHVRETIVTFEEEPVAAAEMAHRMDEVAAVGLPWLVAEREGEVLGYAHASPWRSRRAYRFAVETTIYVARHVAGRGIGTRLYGELILELREQGLHAAIGGIALPNAASVALHEKLGFRKVAHLPEVGFKLGRWIDVGYWHLLL